MLDYLKRFLLIFIGLQAGIAFADYRETVLDLNASSFIKKQQAVKQIINVDEYVKNERTLPIIKALRDGKLFGDATAGQLFIASDVAQGSDKLNIIDAFTSKELGAVPGARLKRVSINNALRRQIHAAVASMELRSPDVKIRLAAVQSLKNSIDDGFLPLINERIDKEPDSVILIQLKLIRGLMTIKSNDTDVRLQALSDMGDSIDAEVVTALTAVTATSEDGHVLEHDEKVREKARAMLKIAEQKRAAYKSVEDIVFGISLGSVLLLSAVGLAITFGVMGIINMAHGELMMIGAYTTYVVQQLMPQSIEYSLLVAIPAAFLVAGAVGMLMERTVIRFLYGRPLETLLATFGISLVLQQAARSIFSPLNKTVITPSWMSGFLQINPALAITWNRLYIIIFSIVLFFALIYALKRTMFGLQMRAVTQNRAMASSMGIRTSWVDALTFGLGSGIAGVAGVALSQLTNVGPNLGQGYIIDSFMVVVFGGVGNLFGTLFGAMTLGVVNKVLEPVTGAVLAKIVMLVFIILFIQRKPRGMFALKGRFVEG